MKKTLIRFLLGLALTTITSAASAKSLFDNFYFFGDSLSDMGNGPGSPVTNPDGATWTSYFSGQFGGNSTPSSSGGNNYAYAGAVTGNNIPNPDDVPNVNQQVQIYLSNSNYKANPKALYALWAGGNDIFDGLEYGIPVGSIVNNGAGNMDAAVQTLHNAGAKYIMVFNLPNLGATPFVKEYFPDLAADFNAITTAYNQELASKLSAEGFDVIQLDIYSLFNDVIANPSHFGLTNVTDECDNATNCDPSKYLFWNGIHPTSAGQAMVGDYAYDEVVAPLYASILAEAPFSIMDAQNFNIENQLYNVRTDMTALPAGATSVFASTSYTPYRQNSDGTARLGFDAHSTDLSAGIIHRVNNNLVTGFGLAHSFGHADFGKHRGSMDTAENMVSLFGGYQYGKFYVDGIGSFGLLDFNDIRSVPIGVSANAAKGETNGSQFGLDVITGYNVINDALKTGPIFNMDYQHVNVDAFAETSNLDSVPEQYGEQKNDSLTTGLGWQASYTTQINSVPVMPFAQLTYNHQWLDKDRDVDVGLVSIPGSHWTIPVHVSGPSKNYALASLGVSTTLTKNVNLSLNYQTTLFFADGRTQNIGANVQVNI